MKISFASIGLLAALVLLFGGIVSSEGAELIKNPTLKDLQGHWHGFSQTTGGRISVTSYMQITGRKAAYSSESGGYKAVVTIKGEEINIDTPGGKISNVCKLSKESDTLVLNCTFEVARFAGKGAFSGTRRLEKDK